MLIRVLIAAFIAGLMTFPAAFTKEGASAVRFPEHHWTYRPCDLTRQVCQIG